VLTRALSSLLYSDWREFGAIRILSPLKPDVVIDNVRRTDHDVIVPEELKEFGVTGLGAEVKGSRFEMHWIAESGFASPRMRGSVSAVENGSRIAVRFNGGPIDGLLTASLPLMAIAGMLAGRSPWYWVALGGISVGLLVMSQRNRSAHPMRERLIQLISIAAKAPH